MIYYHTFVIYYIFYKLSYNMYICIPIHNYLFISFICNVVEMINTSNINFMSGEANKVRDQDYRLSTQFAGCYILNVVVYVEF